jgi:predicted RNase H-like HicB family nuclease
MVFTLECEQEAEGRWITALPELPGILAYGSSSTDAMLQAKAMALRVTADRLENGASQPISIQFSLPLAA